MHDVFFKLKCRECRVGRSEAETHRYVYVENWWVSTSFLPTLLYSFNMQRLLSDWQPGGLGIAFFRPSPLFLPQYGVMPIYSIGQIAVACIGVIDNLPEIREELISDDYQFHSKNVAETLSLLLQNYLEFHHLPFVRAIEVMMTKLKGRFALMALVTDGKWLMLGCRDYPLAVAKKRNEPTIYFGTDIEMVAQFSPSKTSVFGNQKPEIFYGSSF